MMADGSEYAVGGYGQRAKLCRGVASASQIRSADYLLFLTIIGTIYVP
jgi:hypothetical protein